MKSIKKSKFIRFEWKHVLIVFLTLIIFQVFVSHLQQDTLRGHLSDTMDWYKKNSAEQIGNLTTNSLEILLEADQVEGEENKLTNEKNLIHAFNTVLKQPLMNRNVSLMCVLVPFKDKYLAIDLGQSLYAYFYSNNDLDTAINPLYNDAVVRYAGIHENMLNAELTYSTQEEQNVFHVFVPLVPYGEYSGAVYLKIIPDVSFISRQILKSFNKTVIIFSSLILLGLLGMFYISAYTIKDRDDARELLYKEREDHLLDQLAQKKEYLFTKRIYHTHHKAEKVMGFINEDLESIGQSNFKEIKYRISKYANFISRVIYDMKWYNPPIHTIRGQIFRTNLNELLRFIVNHIFLRISFPVQSIEFDLKLDDSLPSLKVNEFVIWEIIEPIIQNSIDHSHRDIIKITIITKYNKNENTSLLTIEDNGNGIREDLLEINENGIKRLFLENISTKEEEEKNCGYGCYLAHEISKRCGWEIDAENREDSGGRITILIRHLN